MICWRTQNRAKRGFTLMELMVYIAIVGIVVLVAGQAFSNSTKFRVRTQNMLRATQEAENVAMLFKEDAAQMGAKSAKEAGAAASGAEFGDKFGAVHDSVYMDPNNTTDVNKDHSSFLISSSSGFSDLIFRRVRYDDQGLLKAVEEVNWFVVNNTLKRSCRTIDGDADGDICPKNKTREEAREAAAEIATHVSRFEIQAPTPTTAEEEQIFPTSGDDFRLIPRTGDNFYDLLSQNDAGTEHGDGNQITLTRFHSNYDFAEDKLKSELDTMNQVFAVNVEDYEGSTWKGYCQDRGLIPLEKDNTYEISFEIPFVSVASSSTFETQPFVPGEDHMSVGFRGMTSGDFATIKGKDNKTKVLIDDFLFYPPYSSTASTKRVMRFSVPENIDSVCLAFTFACYSPLATKAKLKIRNLKVKRIAGQNYRFDNAHPYNPESHKNDKKNIKALKLNLQIARGGKNGQHGETGDVEMVVPIPSNGPTD